MPTHGHPTGVIGFLAALMLLVAFPPQARAAQLDIASFSDMDSWPLYAPGDLALDNAGLRNQRIDLNGMTLDVLEGWFHASPSLWILWVARGNPADSTGTAPLDALLVDRETFRVQFRIAAGPGETNWAGLYELLQHHPDQVVRVEVGDDGTVEREVLRQEVSTFDFAAFPFLFPFIGLEEGKSFRLANVGAAGDLSPRTVGVRVQGRTTITDGTGQERPVWEVALLTASRQALVSFYVTEEAPWFWGWHMRRVIDGSTVGRFEYFGHRAT